MSALSVVRFWLSHSIDRQQSQCSWYRVLVPPLRLRLYVHAYDAALGKLGSHDFAYNSRPEHSLCHPFHRAPKIKKTTAKRRRDVHLPRGA